MKRVRNYSYYPYHSGTIPTVFQRFLRCSIPPDPEGTNYASIFPELTRYVVKNFSSDKIPKTGRVLKTSTGFV